MEEKAEAKIADPVARAVKYSRYKEITLSSLCSMAMPLTKATFSIFCLQPTTSTAELYPPLVSPPASAASMCCLLPPLCYHPLCFVVCPWKVLSLAGAALEGLSEEEELDLCTIVSGFRTVYRGILKCTYGRRLRAHRHLRHHGGCLHLHP
jgi:hypothetical protein